jgi:putative flippase GtrA
VLALDHRPVAPPAAPAPGGRSAAAFARYCTVGASGYVVNSALFWALAGTIAYPLAFAVAFLVAATTNFALNRAWTFRAGGRVSPQYARFLTVSLAALAIDLLVLVSLAEAAGVPKLPAGAIAIVAATPATFVGNRLWTFRGR